MTVSTVVVGVWMVAWLADRKDAVVARNAGFRYSVVVHSHIRPSGSAEMASFTGVAGRDVSRGYSGCNGSVMTGRA